MEKTKLGKTIDNIVAGLIFQPAVGAQLSCRAGAQHDRNKFGKRARMEPTPNSPTQRRKANRKGAPKSS